MGGAHTIPKVGRSLKPVSVTYRTDTLLLKLSLVVGREVFYAALWGSVLTSPSIRLPASLFVVTHMSRDTPGKEQKYMLGTDYQLTVGTAPPDYQLTVGAAPPEVWAWLLRGGEGAPCPVEEWCTLCAPSQLACPGSMAPQ